MSPHAPLHSPADSGLGSRSLTPPRPSVALALLRHEAADSPDARPDAHQAQASGAARAWGACGTVDVFM
eukprot:1126284-Rhodomonas_salina.1